MIDRRTLLADLQRLLRTLEADLLERSESDEVPEVGRTLSDEFRKARDAQRTGQNYEDWRSDHVTQVAAGWVLTCVFARFLEDNRLVDPARIAGPGPRLQQARDEHELYFRAHPVETDRHYLLHVFAGLAELPGCDEIFATHNVIQQLPQWLSGDAAGQLLQFFQRIHADTGVLVHDFSDPRWDTRFLGDLYQDLSEAARKKYALLQTPEFVEEFILERTLEPALDEFGLEQRVQGSGFRVQGEEPETSNLKPETFKMIDPACGSGHFLLGAFRRILDRWRKIEPDQKTEVLVQRTLDSIHGVDVNPYAVAIARFRLLLAAMRECGIVRLDRNVRTFHFNLACGDSLLHAPFRESQTESQAVFDFEKTRDIDDECQHAYAGEDLLTLKRMLADGQYHAVVANPPYITPKDRLLNERYRKRFTACHRQYSLAVPFMERIFRLAVAGGYTGQITANSFMKREFGKKLIEQFFKTVDLTHVIDTSGAYIPGHGTPTVILLGRQRRPLAGTLRTVMGIRGEPSTPDDPALGRVWSAIVSQIDQPGSQSEFVSVGDSDRQLFERHPWSIGGGGAAELKERLEEVSGDTLNSRCESIGFVCITKADEFFQQPHECLKRKQLEVEHTRPFGLGEEVRDWFVTSGDWVIFPYDSDISTTPLERMPQVGKEAWRVKTELGNRKVFGGQNYFEAGKPWYEYGQIPIDRLRTPLSIVFAFVSTHNHFVLDRGCKVFNRSAPVIKLPADASEDDHLALLGLLNSSTACFWMKQVFHDKGSSVDTHGARQTTIAFENFREFTATGLLKFPIAEEHPLELARQLDVLAGQLSANSPAGILTQRCEDAKKEDGELCAFAPLREHVSEARARYEHLRGLMIFLQEELDWECYRLYGLTDQVLFQTQRHGEHREESAPDSVSSVPLWFLPVRLGQRAFEIVLARKMAHGEVQSTWFERHGSTPITELPGEWPDDYRRLVERRIELIETDPNIALIEQPEYKRRWNTEAWESQVERALRSWLLDRLESYFDYDGRMRDELAGAPSVGDERPDAMREIAVRSTARLADVAASDRPFMEVAELYRDDPAFDIHKLVAELVGAECVPLLPVLRYKPSGLRKRAEWERVWQLQRAEDAIDARAGLPDDDPNHLTLEQATQRKQHEIGDIPVPPKYISGDFLSSGGSRYWSLRGKLDVPKERWISFPHCEGEDGTLPIAWAGYDHLQLALALGQYFQHIKDQVGGAGDPRLVPLLGCLIELLPWLRQWHGDLHPEYDTRMDQYFEGLVQQEARELGLTLDDIRQWQPPKRTARRARGKEKP